MSDFLELFVTGDRPGADLQCLFQAEESETPRPEMNETPRVQARGLDSWNEESGCYWPDFS